MSVNAIRFVRAARIVGLLYALGRKLNSFAPQSVYDKLVVAKEVYCEVRYRAQ